VDSSCRSDHSPSCRSSAQIKVHKSHEILWSSVQIKENRSKNPFPTWIKENRSRSHFQLWTAPVDLIILPPVDPVHRSRKTERRHFQTVDSSCGQVYGSRKPIKESISNLDQGEPIKEAISKLWTAPVDLIILPPVDQVHRSRCTNHMKSCGQVYRSRKTDQRIHFQLGSRKTDQEAISNCGQLL
jgi:hypothetical protein